MAAAVLFSAISLDADTKGASSIRKHFEPEFMANSISTDGTLFAFGRREETELYLCVVNLDTGERQRAKVGEDAALPFDPDEEVLPATMPFLSWANSKRIIYGLGTGELFAIDADLENRTELLVYKRPVASASNDYFRAFRVVRSMLIDEPDHILVESSGAAFSGLRGSYASARRYDFYRVNIHTGAASPYHGDYGIYDQHLVDPRGTIRGALKRRGSRKRELFVAEPASAALVPIRTLLGDEIVDRYRLEFRYEPGIAGFLNQAVVLGFGYNPEWLFFCSNAGRNTYALFAVNLRTREVVGPMLEDDRFDIATPNSRLGVGILQHSYVTRSLAVVRSYFEREVAFWLEPAFAEAHAQAAERFAGQTLRLTSWSDDLRRFAVFSTDNRRGWKIEVLDKADERWIPIMESPPRDAITVPVWIDAPQGHRILCYLTVPASLGAGQPNKTVVLLHGGPWTRDTWNPSGEVGLLAERGYTVLQVNFRGSVGFGREYALAAQARFGDAALEDVVTALQWCVDRRLTDPERVSAMGGSYGGYLALYAGAKHPELFRRIVAIAPVTDLVRIVKDGRFDSESRWASYIFSREMLGDPRRDRNQLTGQSPLHLVESYRTPILLAHGVEDRIVPVEHSDLLFRALKKRSPDHQYLRIKDAGHGGWKAKDRETLYQMTLDFLE